MGHEEAGVCQWRQPEWKVEQHAHRTVQQVQTRRIHHQDACKSSIEGRLQFDSRITHRERWQHDAADCCVTHRHVASTSATGQRLNAQAASRKTEANDAAVAAAASMHAQQPQRLQHLGIERGAGTNGS